MDKLKYIRYTKKVIGITSCITVIFGLNYYNKIDLLVKSK